MASFKDVLLVSGGIASAALSGGTSEVILAGIAGAAKLLGGEDEKEPNPNDPNVKWRVERIQEWMRISLENMQRPMRPELKAELLRGKIEGDWFQHYGTKADRSWVKQMAEQTWNAVKNNIALGIIKGT